MTKSIGISTVCRKDQLAGGVFSVFENLAIGLNQILCDPIAADKPSVTVFYGSGVPRQQYASMKWTQVGDALGRFVAESSLACRKSGSLEGLLFLNYYTPPFVRSRCAVTVIHDLQYLHMPELYSIQKRMWLRHSHKMTLRRCSRVVAISNVVKSDIVRAYGDKWHDKIEVIWNPVSVDRFSVGAECDIVDGRPYILCVAVDRPQKNLYRLIRAFHQLRSRFPEHCLVLAGQLRALRRSPREQSRSIGRRMPATVDLVAELGLSDCVKVTGFVDDDQLGALYRGATMCILPSEFEGFGMPAVEALAMGKPTLVSGLPVLREVTMQSAQYLDDPTNTDAMADAIATMLRNPSNYQPSMELVRKIRDCFSPRTIAEQYLRVLSA